MNTEHQSTKDKLREWLKAGKSITVLEATIVLNTVDLRQYITQLRREGLYITDEWQCNEHTGKRFKKYWILKDEKEKPVQPLAKIIPIIVPIIEGPIIPGQQALKFG